MTPDKVSLDRFICSMIENFPEFPKRLPLLYTKALRDQGLEYKDGGIYPIAEPPVQLTDFELEVEDMVNYVREHPNNLLPKYAVRHAKNLMDIARRQICEEINMDEMCHKKKEEDFNQVYLGGYMSGIREVLEKIRGI